MRSARRLGPLPLHASGSLPALTNSKNSAVRDSSGRIHVQNGKPALGGGCRTDVLHLCRPADWPRCEGGGRCASIQGPLADLAGPRHCVPTTPPPGGRCGEAHRHPHAALSALDARRTRDAVETTCTVASWNASRKPASMCGRAIARIKAHRAKSPAYLAPFGGGGLAARSGSDCVLPSREAAERIRDRFPVRGLGAAAGRVGPCAAAAARADLKGSRSQRPRGRGGAGVRHPSVYGPVGCIGSRRGIGRWGHAGRSRPAACAPDCAKRPARRPDATPRAGVCPSQVMRASARRGGDAR